MRVVAPDLLWIGNVHDLQDVRRLLSLGIQAVVDLAANEAAGHFPRDVVCCRIPLNDGTENRPVMLRLAILTLVELVRAGTPTLVACSAGMSRSPAIVAAALSLIENRDPDEILRRTASSGPHDVAPALWHDVKQTVAQIQLRSD